MQRSRIALTLALVLGGFGVSGSWADEISLSVSDLPAVIRRAAAKAFPGAKWTKAIRQTEGGEAVYEVTGTDRNGLAVSATITAEGDVEATEAQVPVSELPKVIADALKAYPGTHWTEATKKVEDGETTYEVNGKDKEDREVNIWLDDDGEIDLVEIELSVTDLPKIVADAVKPFPDVKWVDAVKTIEDGETSFELNGTDAHNRKVNADISADGIAQVETELTLAEVPAAVLDALKAKRPKFQPKSVVSLAETKKRLIYIFEGEEANGAELVLSVSADGRTIRVEDDED